MKIFFKKLLLFAAIIMCINVKVSYAEPSTAAQNQNNSLVLKAYNIKEKKVEEVVEKLEKDKLVLTSIIAVLLLMLESIIERILKRFSKVNKSIHIMKILLPLLVCTVINSICYIANESEFYKVLSYGFCLKPKSNTIMNWVIYLNIWTLLISTILTIYKLFRSYNLIVSLIKIAEAALLYFILCIVIAAAGKQLMTGIICVVLFILVVSSFVNVQAPESK